MVFPELSALRSRVFGSHRNAQYAARCVCRCWRVREFPPPQGRRSLSFTGGEDGKVMENCLLMVFVLNYFDCAVYAHVQNVLLPFYCCDVIFTTTNVAVNHSSKIGRTLFHAARSGGGVREGRRLVSGTTSSPPIPSFLDAEH